VANARQAVSGKDLFAGVPFPPFIFDAPFLPISGPRDGGVYPSSSTWIGTAGQ
jgi:hypothetical protein